MRGVGGAAASCEFVQKLGAAEQNGKALPVVRHAPARCMVHASSNLCAPDVACGTGLRPLL